MAASSSSAKRLVQNITLYLLPLEKHCPDLIPRRSQAVPDEILVNQKYIYSRNRTTSLAVLLFFKPEKKLFSLLICVNAIIFALISIFSVVIS